MDFRFLFLALAALPSSSLAENAAPLIAQSRLYSERIATATRVADKKNAAETSLHLARQAVAADPQNGEAHVTLAIALGKMTDFTDNHTKMSYARLILAEAETGLRLDPRNAGACLILGKWHDEMTRLNPVLKAIAATLYGKLPDASVSEAEKYLRLAAQWAPQSIRPHAELAAFLERAGQRPLARAEWQKILPIAPLDAEDRAFAAQAQVALR